MLTDKRLLGIFTASSALFVAALPARAQTPLATVTGNVGFEGFGSAVSAAGDVDADGVPDFVVGSDTLTSGSMGRVWIYSGASHQVLHMMVGTLATSLLGAPKGGGSGVALVLSGLDGSVIYTFEGAAFDDNLGESVANAGDVDGDG